VVVWGRGRKEIPSQAALGNFLACRKYESSYWDIVQQIVQFYYVSIIPKYYNKNQNAYKIGKTVE
jgi:hypothetical protein